MIYSTTSYLSGKLYRRIIIFGFLVLIVSLQAQSLEEQALAKINSLDSLILLAEADGIDVLKEKLTIRTAEIFLDYANWDEANVAKNTDYFLLVNRYKDNAAEMATLLPDFERNDVILLVEEAISYLQGLVDGAYFRKPTPEVDWANVSLENDRLIYNNRPVFLADYTWKPEIDRLNDYHGQQDGFFMTPGDVIDEYGTIKSFTASDLNQKPEGKLGFIFLNHKNAPQWAKDKYGPGFDLGDELRYTEYDIDNPGAREMQNLLLAGTVPIMAGKKYTQLGYMLCNEPHFYANIDGTKELWACGPVSEYTKEKFRTWLSNKHDSIAELNEVWGSDFANFDSVTIEIPIDLALRGTPLWYDWATFNNFRVTAWYTFLRDEIQKHDPAAKTHLKIMPNLWSENNRNHGIDFEALSDMTEILGNDAGSENSRMWGETPWDEHYALMWRELFMSYDFLKSVGPEKPIFNSENHFLSTGKFRDLYLDPAYARCLFWSATTLGLNSSQIWYWPRLENGGIKNNAGKGYAGSVIQQPRVANTVHATLLDLNSFGEEITAMQRQKKPIRIFYSETSAMNKLEHMDDVFELYEALSFEGVALGFATENIIKKQDNALWEVILVHKTEYVTQSELDALQLYLDNGGTVVIDGQSLKFNEYGKALSALEQGSGSLISSGSLSEMKNKAIDIIEGEEMLPKVSVTEINMGGSKGCHWKSILNAEGNPVLSIVNLGKTNAQLSIELKGAEGITICTDLIKGIAVSSEPTLKPYDVYFIEVRDSILADTTDVTDTTFVNSIITNQEIGQLYPNLSSGEFNIDFNVPQTRVDLLVYNLDGSNILSKSYRNVSSISDQIMDEPQGLYIFKVVTRDRSQSFQFLKQ